MIATEAEFRAELAIALPADSEPALTADEFDTLVQQARRVDNGHNAPDSYSPWLSRTQYAQGLQTVPDPRNGYVYTGTTAGITGAVAPVWPTVLAQTVADGTVTWTCAAVAPWLGAWDLDWAAEWGWRMKAGKIVQVVDQVVRGGAASEGDNRGQMYNHCLAQVQIWHSSRLVKSGLGLRPYGNAGY